MLVLLISGLMGCESDTAFDATVAAKAAQSGGSAAGAGAVRQCQPGTGFQVDIAASGDASQLVPITQQTGIDAIIDQLNADAETACNADANAQRIFEAARCAEECLDSGCGFAFNADPITCSEGTPNEPTVFPLSCAGEDDEGELDFGTVSEECATERPDSTYWTVSASSEGSGTATCECGGQPDEDDDDGDTGR